MSSAPELRLLRRVEELVELEEAVAPPYMKHRRYRGCDAPATAVALGGIRGLASTVTYCGLHAHLAERFGRTIRYFPICHREGCGRPAVALAFVATRTRREEAVFVCELHDG